MGGMIAHFNGMTNEFDHYVVSKDMWWTVVASYVKGFIDEVSEGLLCDIG